MNKPTKTYARPLADLVHRCLGETFARLQKFGPREFYEGETARRIARTQGCEPKVCEMAFTAGLLHDVGKPVVLKVISDLGAQYADVELKQAVQQGYDKVFWTIVDAHVTTLVAGVVLMQYGSGPVRGFAVTLSIGLVASLFTSIVVTRAIMEYLTRHDTARLSV